METAETNSSLGYGTPPWVFKGSALYQLHLVKAETARAFIPKEFRLVEAFGYTLGGFFLANYEDSPAGIFDELVIVAGIVWNPPTSCAWAARVLVNSAEACFHGRKEFGLPSQVATFTKRPKLEAVNRDKETRVSSNAIPGTKRSRFGGFLNKIGMADSPDYTQSTTDIQVKETNNHTAMDICSINLTATAAFENNTKRWISPAVKISLPNFSGRTEYNSQLLKYSCQIECRLRAVPPAKVSASNTDGEVTSDNQSTHELDLAAADSRDYKRNLIISVMLSKPILALEFHCLKMEVKAPTVVSQQNRV